MEKKFKLKSAKKAWSGETIAPQDNIQIIGKVDKEWNKNRSGCETNLKK